MADDQDSGKVLRMRLTASRAQERVRALAADSINIKWTDHVRQRMYERGIDAIDVMNILKKGVVEEAPVDGESPGEIKVKVTRKLTSGREAGVVVVLPPNSSELVLATTEWEDLP